MSKTNGMPVCEFTAAARKIAAATPETTAHPWQLNVVQASAVEPKPVEWLWPGRIPSGKNSLLVGPPGVGKSYVSLDIGSCISVGGPWPDGAGNAPLGEVLILAAEDGIADTMRPRIDLLGGDPEKFFIIESIRRTDYDGKKIDRAVRLDTDLAAIEQLLQAHPETRLIIIDPISEYVGRIDSHKNEQVRGVLSPLALLAEKYGIAILSVTHFNKNGAGPALYRTMGSLAFTAQARAVWGFIPDADDNERILLLPLKNNLSKKIPGLAFSIVDGIVVWEEDPVDISADEAIQNLSSSKPQKGVVAEAADWLRERLAGGQRVESDALNAEAKENGFSVSTFRRAKAAVGAQSKRGLKYEGCKWFISLPIEPPERQEENTAQSARQQAGLKAAHTRKRAAEDLVMHRVAYAAGLDHIELREAAEAELAMALDHWSNLKEIVGPGLPPGKRTKLINGDEESIPEVRIDEIRDSLESETGENRHSGVKIDEVLEAFKYGMPPEPSLTNPEFVRRVAEKMSRDRKQAKYDAQDGPREHLEHLEQVEHVVTEEAQEAQDAQDAQEFQVIDPDWTSIIYRDENPE